MTIDIRNIYNQFNISLTPFDTVASFADDAPLTAVVLNTPPFSIYSAKYAIFDSWVYKNIYTLSSQSNTGFDIDATFAGDDPGVAAYDVTSVYSLYLSVVEYTSGIPCLATSPNLEFIQLNLLYYNLDIQTSTIESTSFDGQGSIKYITGTDPSKNRYWLAADNASGGCLSGTGLYSILLEVVGGGDLDCA